MTRAGRRTASCQQGADEGSAATTRIYLLTTFRHRIIRFASLAHRGASSGDVPEGGVRLWRFAAAARNRSSREARDPARRALRLGCEELRCTDPEEMPEKEARTPAQNRHGGAPIGARPASWDAWHPAGCLACRARSAHARLTRQARRVPLHPSACRRSAHPSDRGPVEVKVKTRARMRRGNEMGCLKS